MCVIKFYSGFSFPFKNRRECLSQSVFCYHKQVDDITEIDVKFKIVVLNRM